MQGVTRQGVHGGTADEDATVEFVVFVFGDAPLRPGFRQLVTDLVVGIGDAAFDSRSTGFGAAEQAVQRVVSEGGGGAGWVGAGTEGQGAVKFAEFVVHQCFMKIDDGSGLKNDSNFLDSIG